jgi:puromycin-sensitive aminopeptidase
VIPRRYQIRLEPDLEAASFTGSETISVVVAEPVREVLLNAHELAITGASLNRGATQIQGRVALDEERQRAMIALEEQASPGDWTLTLEFKGALNDQLVGFYKSTFTDVDGVQQSIATTQFEATDARRAFPCWDEPDLKAVFSLTLVVPEHLTAISNTREIERRKVGPGKVEVRFADTMLMSTYLVAFLVGPFEAGETFTVDGVPCRIVTPKGKGHLSSYAKECAEHCLRYLREYYGIPYPGDKIDHIAVPDFAFGAMENLGCITYRESALLLDPEVSTQQELLRVLDVIGHELAHMWFGDLVTMRWWDGIWLNEAFASFMEMKATHARRPEWKRWLAFGAVERPWAFAVDALRATRPVEFEVSSPDEANEMFDALTYGKGSSVLRMIEQFIGEDRFRAGVGKYLRAHSYGNTSSSDLWHALDEACDQPISPVMDGWIHQPGYPQIEVSVDQADGRLLRVRQRRFLTIPDESDQTIWKVPVQLRGEAGGSPFHRRLLLDSVETALRLDRPVDWVMGNAGGHGFFRVRHDAVLLGELIDRLPLLDDLERYTLVDDTWAFVEADQLGAPHYLDLIRAYRDETQQAIWQAVLGGLGAVSHHLVADASRPGFRALVQDLVEPAFGRLGWDPRPGEDDLTRRLRGQLVVALGRLADAPEVVERCRAMASAAMNDPRSVDPDLARAALFVVAAHGRDDDHERFLTGYKEAPTPQDELRYLQALAHFDDPELTLKNVSQALDGTIRTQDAAWVLALTFGARRHGADAWAAVRQRWDEVLRLPQITMRRMVEGLPALSQPEVANDVQAFFAETHLPSAAKALAQNLERLQANLALRQREAAAVAEYLKQ